MTRTTNTLRVTFSANIGSGEGYLTEKARNTLESIPDDGWLWAKDVLGEHIVKRARYPSGLIYPATRNI